MASSVSASLVRVGNDLNNFGHQCVEIVSISRPAGGGWPACRRSACNSCLVKSVRRLHCSHQLIACERNIVETDPNSVPQCISNGRRNGSLCGLACSQERLSWPLDDMNFDGFRNRSKSQDRVGRPIDAGNSHLIETHRLIECPTC